MILFSFVGKESVLKALSCVLRRKVTGQFLAAVLTLHVAIGHGETPESSAFAATIPNKTGPPDSAPEGMVWIPGGEFSMGAAVAGQGSAEMPMASNDSGPVHRVRVDGFWMDAAPVTNEQFEKFVKATSYITIAERTP